MSKMWQLQHGAQEVVMVKAACWASVGHEKMLHSFYGHFCSAIRLREVSLGYTMPDTLEVKESFGIIYGELWATVA